MTKRIVNLEILKKCNKPTQGQKITILEINLKANDCFKNSDYNYFYVRTVSYLPVCLWPGISTWCCIGSLSQSEFKPDECSPCHDPKMPTRIKSPFVYYACIYIV